MEEERERANLSSKRLENRRQPDRWMVVERVSGGGGIDPLRVGGKGAPNAIEFERIKTEGRAKKKHRPKKEGVLPSFVVRKKDD